MAVSKDHDQVVLGAFAAPHGVRGLIKVKAFTDDPLAVAAYGPVQINDGRTVQLTACGVKKGLVLTAVEGVTSREDAETLRGKTFSVDRNKLPPTGQDEIYQTDLIGRIVHDPDLGEIGKVMAIFDFGAGSMLDVKRKKGKSVLLPFGGSHPFSLESGKIVLTVDPAWLENEEPSD
jgi:16S rRNA processing protein RimM